MTSTRCLPFVLLVACARAAAPVTVTPVTPPAPPTPPAPAWGDPAPLVDDRAAQWGGDLGALADVRWITLASRTAIHAHLAGWFERDAVIVLRRGPAGLEVARLITDRGFRVTTTGVIGTSSTIVPADDLRSAGRAFTELFVPFAPVPPAALPELAMLYERTPVPGTPTGTVWQGMAVEISTTTAHVRFEVGAAVPSAPTAPSKDLSEMATRFAQLFGA
jgi:hypothetical protein